MDNLNHIKACKQMLVESAAEVDLTVTINTSDKYPMIVFSDKDGYPVYNAYNCVSTAIGFIHGIKSKYKFNQ